MSSPFPASCSQQLAKSAWLIQMLAKHGRIVAIHCDPYYIDFRVRWHYPQKVNGPPIYTVEDIIGFVRSNL